MPCGYGCRRPGTGIGERCGVIFAPPIVFALIRVEAKGAPHAGASIHHHRAGPESGSAHSGFGKQSRHARNVTAGPVLAISRRQRQPPAPLPRRTAAARRATRDRAARGNCWRATRTRRWQSLRMTAHTSRRRQITQRRRILAVIRATLRTHADMVEEIDVMYPYGVQWRSKMSLVADPTRHHAATPKTIR